MRKLLTIVVLCLMAATMYAQEKDITQFLAIPVDKKQGHADNGRAIPPYATSLLTRR